MKSIQNFEMRNIKHDSNILIVAKRGTGKSFIMKNLIYHLQNISGGAIIAPTDRMNSFYKFFFPDLYIHYEYSEILIKDILDRQCDINKGLISKRISNFNPSSLLVLDNCIRHLSKSSNYPYLKEIFTKNKEYKMTNILTRQTPNLPFNIKFDYVFLLAEDSKENRIKLHNRYVYPYLTFEEFEPLFKSLTQDFGAMVIDNSHALLNIENTIYRFKAESFKYMFTRPVFNEIHDELYNPKFMEKYVPSLIANKQSENVNHYVTQQRLSNYIDHDYHLFFCFINKMKDNLESPKNNNDETPPNKIINDVTNDNNYVQILYKDDTY